MIKIVDFYKYCPTCKFYSTNEKDKPCSECLNVPARKNSKKPVKHTIA